MMLAPAGWLWTEIVPRIGGVEAAGTGAEGTGVEDTVALLAEECFGCLSALFSGDGEACGDRVPGSTVFSEGAASCANCFCTSTSACAAAAKLASFSNAWLRRSRACLVASDVCRSRS